MALKIAGLVLIGFRSPSATFSFLCFLYFFPRFRNQPQSGKRYQSIYQQNLNADFISTKKFLGVRAKDIGKDRRKNTNEGDHLDR